MRKTDKYLIAGILDSSQDVPFKSGQRRPYGLGRWFRSRRRGGPHSAPSQVSPGPTAAPLPPLFHNPILTYEIYASLQQNLDAIRPGMLEKLMNPSTLTEPVAALAYSSGPEPKDMSMDLSKNTQIILHRFKH